MRENWDKKNSMSIEWEEKAFKNGSKSGETRRNYV
jgi:hypothetical protein